MKRYPLIRTFALYSMFAFILMGIVLSLVIYGHIKNDKLGNLEEVTRVTINTAVKNNLAKTDFTDNISETKSSQIMSNIIETMDLYDIQSIILINQDEKVIMSDNSDFTGKPPDKKDLEKIFNREVPFVVSDAYALNNAKDENKGKLIINVYEPIIYDGKVEGVVVLQILKKNISEHAKMIVQVIALTVFGGFLILFLLLVGILYKTSQTLLNQNKKLINQKSEIELSLKRLDDAYLNTVFALSNAVDARDPYTAGHSERVSKIAMLLSRELKLTEENLKILEYAGLFHDIGKIGIPDHILNKNGKLTDEEYEVIKKHPVIGINILSNVGFLAETLPIIRHHHERFSGNGYPCGIKGEEIPLGSRILAIADTYDAMTTDRPYRQRFSHDNAVAEIQKNSVTQFDNKLVDVFMKIESTVKNIN
ncbi:HD-GYP domain-containing protein [Acetobacterium sp.]|uniref:HD-GYP domain-containing protein n=1 Tax=Acetobacterium sp. TaxID=1872094 RepID=UPI0027252135|nr:HD-GYP domain-containing protein [Acetobacterium sp.]MDO9491292.1 HD-GYP domain-containing protein [Acetobacterium sp.]